MTYLECHPYKDVVEVFENNSFHLLPALCDISCPQFRATLAYPMASGFVYGSVKLGNEYAFKIGIALNAYCRQVTKKGDFSEALREVGWGRGTLPTASKMSRWVAKYCGTPGGTSTLFLFGMLFSLLEVSTERHQRIDLTSIDILDICQHLRTILSDRPPPCLCTFRASHPNLSKRQRVAWCRNYLIQKGLQRSSRTRSFFQSLPQACHQNFANNRPNIQF